MDYTQHVSTRVTPQDQVIFGSGQVPNSGGGYAWEVTDWVKLDRFLILGTEGGSYYASEQKLTVENAEAVLRCIKADGIRAVARIVEVSHSGRAPKNDPAVFALAMAAGLGDTATKQAALASLPKVARIGTHLFDFIETCKAFRGWGRGMRRAIGQWYTERDADALAYQVLKYRNRHGWTHRDALRKSHPKAAGAHQALFEFVTHEQLSDDLPPLVHAFLRAQETKTAGEAIRVIREHPKLSWEMFPTEVLRHADVWEALLPNIKIEAMVRNLARMTANGLIAPMSNAARMVVDRLANAADITASRLHPVKILAELTTYEQGHREKGDLRWEPVTQVIDALDGAFYLAFGNIIPASKRTMLSLDLSNSMTSGMIAGIPGLTPRRGAAAMSLVTAASERDHVLTGFTARGDNPMDFPGRSRENLPLAISMLSISPKQRLSDVVRMIEGYGQRNGGFGGTDCSLPMRYALAKQLAIDTFVIYTDSETWAGEIHPSQALCEYRRETGINAKLVVVGMVANKFSIADPHDAGMLDVVGFDTAAPQLISDFSAH